ncbi:MAG: type II toxin-antitoxin system ParD family antitoxin [Pseudomonadota bacterium]
MPRSIDLTEDQEKLVQGLVETGRFADADAAVAAGLSMLADHEAEVARLRERVAIGLAQADRGEFAEGTAEEVINRAFAKAAQNT